MSDSEERPLGRRQVIRGGLATLAAAVMTPALGACDGDTPMDGGPEPFDAGGPVDAGPMDAGPQVFMPRTIPPRPTLRSLIGDIGDLGDPDANDVRLPPGFTSRIIARSGEVVAPSSHEWHNAPDGGATFMTEDGGWIYVSNSEVPIIGGVSAVRFDASGAIVDAYPILEDTNINCAGGPTPWHTWLSCEEAANGRVYECDPWGEQGAIVRPALGVFKHEAVTVDEINGHLYLSEDESEGGFYRYRPNGTNEHGFPNLSAGTLEIAEVDVMGNVTWHELPDPQLAMSMLATRRQVSSSTPFDGGEGIWHQSGMIYMSTKGDTRVWAYDVAAETISVLYDGEAMGMPPLTGVDNITVSCCGDVLVAEDAGSMQIVAILPTGELVPLMQGRRAGRVGDHRPGVRPERHAPLLQLAARQRRQRDHLRDHRPLPRAGVASRGVRALGRHRRMDAARADRPRRDGRGVARRARRRRRRR